MLTNRAWTSFRNSEGPEWRHKRKQKEARREWAKQKLWPVVFMYKPCGQQY